MLRTRIRARALAGAVLAAVTAALLAGCGGAGTGGPGQSAAPSSDGKYPVTVQGSGGGVTLTAAPRNVVSLSPTTTEMLFAIGAGKQVKAVDDQSNYPSTAPKTKLSGFKPSPEAIAAYHPDLVTLSYDAGDVVNGLRKLKIPVYVADSARTLADSYREITDLGKLTGHNSQAGQVVTGMKNGIANAVKGLPERTRPLTYYYELDPELHSVTSKTFIGALFARAGLTNIADAADTTGSGYPQLSSEYTVKADPELVFLADTKCCGQTAATAAQRPGWSGLAAIRDKHVYPLDDDVASRWGPRVVQLVQAAAQAAKSVPAA